MSNTKKIKLKEVQPPELTEMLEKIKDKGIQSICFFNNKGGVGKTTLVANLAAQLALNLDKRILVVDADPQCNLTQYVLTDNEFDELYLSEIRKETIHSIVQPLSIGKGYSEKLPVTKSLNFGFDLIVGDPRLALKEDLLAQDWRDAKAGGTRGLRTTFIFSDLIEKSKENYDFVFFDMGPSLGAINRSILLAADYFIVPMTIDIFSIWAVRNIGEALKVWQTELENGIKLAEDPDEIKLISRNKKHLKFLGYVMQQHKEKSEAGRPRIVEAYAAIKNRLPDEVESKLGALFPSENFNPHLGDIKHFSSLAPKSQSLHTPMITVTLKGSYTSLRAQARISYTQIAHRLIENLSLVK